MNERDWEETEFGAIGCRRLVGIGRLACAKFYKIVRLGITSDSFYVALVHRRADSREIGLYNIIPTMANRPVSDLWLV